MLEGGMCISTLSIDTMFVHHLSVLTKYHFAHGRLL